MQSDSSQFIVLHPPLIKRQIFFFSPTASHPLNKACFEMFRVGMAPIKGYLFLFAGNRSFEGEEEEKEVHNNKTISASPPAGHPLRYLAIIN